MKATATDSLTLSQLPTKARTCHKFDEIHLPLVSVPKLCANGCTVHFGDTTVNVTKDGQVILTGTKDPTRNLYMVPLRDGIGPPTPRFPLTGPSTTATNAYTIPSTVQQLAFLHACAGYPTRTTFLRAIRRNYLLGWPQLTLQKATRLLLKSVHTTNGHLHMLRKNVRSSHHPPDDANTEPPQPRAPASVG